MRVLTRVLYAGGYVCGEGFLNGQLTVTRGLGDFHPDILSMQRQKERLKYSVNDEEPLHLIGPLISGAADDATTCMLRHTCIYLSQCTGEASITQLC